MLIVKNEFIPYKKNYLLILKDKPLRQNLRKP